MKFLQLQNPMGIPDVSCSSYELSSTQQTSSTKELTSQRLAEQRARWETEVETLRQRRNGRSALKKMGHWKTSKKQQGFTHLRWCRISSINSMTCTRLWVQKSSRPIDEKNPSSKSLQSVKSLLDDKFSMSTTVSYSHIYLDNHMYIRMYINDIDIYQLSII